MFAYQHLSRRVYAGRIERTTLPCRPSRGERWTRARLLTRLAVVPALQDVQLVSSSQTVVSGRQVFAFTIKADVRAGENG